MSDPSTLLKNYKSGYASTEHLTSDLGTLNPDAALFEPRKLFDPCIIGVTDTPVDHWEKRKSGSWVAVYCYELLLDILISQVGSYDHAAEYISYNMMGSWLGDNTPMIWIDAQ